MARSIDTHSKNCDCHPCRLKRLGELRRGAPRLSCQVSEKEAALVREEAARQGLSVNAWLRGMIRERFSLDTGEGHAPSQGE